jgi:hypothetical protein
MSVVPAELYGAVNETRKRAREVERHVVSGTQPDHDELRDWRAQFDNVADLLEAVVNEFERQHNETT